MVLHAAVSAADFAVARELFREYVQTPDVAVCVVGFEEELTRLETFYEVVLLAFDGGTPIGCGALRPLADGSAEMKRLYVRPAARGLKAGRALAEGLIEAARKRGYPSIRLDSLPSMQAAQALYESLGFQLIPPYSPGNPPGASCYELKLQEAQR